MQISLVYYPDLGWSRKSELHRSIERFSLDRMCLRNINLTTKDDYLFASRGQDTLFFFNEGDCYLISCCILSSIKKNPPEKVSFPLALVKHGSNPTITYRRMMEVCFSNTKSF